MRKLLIPLLVLSMLVSGCWDLTESEKIVLVTLIGIDAVGNNQIKVCVYEMSFRKQSAGGQGTAKGGLTSEIHEAQAATISEAIRQIDSSDPGRLYFAHTSAIILSEEIARSKGIGSFIDYFERTPEIRRNTWLLIAHKGEFNKIFSARVGSDQNTEVSKEIKDKLENTATYLSFTANTLGDFLNLLWEEGAQPFTAGVRIVSGKNNSSTTKSSNNDLLINETAVFKKEKLAGWLNDQESMGLLFIQGNKNGELVDLNYKGGKILLKCTKVNSTIKPIIKNGKAVINLNVYVISDISESQVNLDFEQSGIDKTIQKLQAAEVKKQIIAAFNKSKELDADIFQFGNLIYGKYPEYYKQMKTMGQDYYQNITLSVSVKSSVNQIGLTNGSLNK